MSNCDSSPEGHWRVGRLGGWSRPAAGRETGYSWAVATGPALGITDRAGRARNRMFVDSAHVARLEFLDETGRVIQTLPERN
jgi:hypothetical protein